MSKKKIVAPKRTVWFYSKSRAPFAFVVNKAARGLEAWFYTGPSEFFGHPNDVKKKAKGK